MSGLKSAWEISLEKSDRLAPELKKKKKLTDTQKKEISEIRKEYKAKIADREVTLAEKLKKLQDRIPPEEFEPAVEELKQEFAREKQKLEEKMESAVEAVHSRSS